MIDLTLPNLLTSIIILFLMILTLKQTNKIQGQNIFNDLIKREERVWDRNEEIGGRIGIEGILNFYEYLAFLFFEGVIDKNMTEKMFKKELIKNYEKYERNVKPDFEHLIRLYEEWK